MFRIMLKFHTMKTILLLISFIFCVSLSAFSQESLEQYSGKYQFPDGNMIKEVFVTLENGSLVISSAFCNALLVKDAGDNFTIPAFKGTAVFKRDQSKKVTSVTIALKDLKLDGIKDEAAPTEQASPALPIIILWENKFLSAP